MDPADHRSAADAGARAATRRADAAHAARGGLVQLLGIIAQGLMPLYYAVVKRLFGPTVFGFYSGTFAITETLSRLGVSGADRGMYRFIAAHRAEGNHDLELRALGTGLRLSAAVTTVMALGLAALAGPLARALGRPVLALTLPYMAPAVAAAALTMVLVAATLGRKVTRVSFFVRGLVEPGNLLIAGTIAYLLGAETRGVAAAHGIAYLVTAAAAVFGASLVFGGRELLAALRSPAHPGFVRFSLPLALSDGANTLFQRTDMLMLPLYVSPEALGAYFVAEVLGRVSANVRYAFDGIAGPLLSEAIALGDRVRLGYNLRLVTRWVTTLSLPIATTMISIRETVLLLYGPSSLVASRVVVLATLGHLLSGTMGVCNHVILMSGRSRLALATQVGATALNFTFCAVLIPKFGITGAAMSVLSSLFLMMAATVVQVWVIERVHPFHGALLKPVAAAAAALIAQLAIVRALPTIAGAAVAVVGGVTVYLGVLLLLRPPREEREVLQSALARVRRAIGRGG